MSNPQALPSQEQLDNLLELTSNQLQIFAKSANFWQLFETAFGTEFDRDIAANLQSQWQSGDLDQVPEIEIISSDILGNATGAYAIGTNKIYLSDTFLATATTAALTSVLLEEIGHAVDAKINQVDRPGDEGELFSALVQGKNLTDWDVARINAENDTATITIADKVIAIEQSALTFNVTFDDLSGQYSSLYTAIQADVVAAGANWNKYIQGNGSLEVLIKFSNIGQTATGGSKATSFLRKNGTLDVYEQGAASEIRTGIDPNGDSPDIEINFNPTYVTNELWFDPNPSASTISIPSNKTDGVSVLMHELGHAFAFNGWRDETTGTLPAYESTFDEKTIFDGTNFFFTGTQATAAYGSAVPLTFGNSTHVGNSSPRPGSNLISDLMNGVVFDRGVRYSISAVDIAILADTGVIPAVSTIPPVRTDFNGDKKADILWRNDNGTVAVWQMNGSSVTSSTLTSTSTLANSWKTAGTGDFDGDKQADILWRNDNGSVALWQMNGSTVTTSTIVSTVSADWKIAGTSDFDGNGKSDILWRNDNGNIALWQMNGATVVSSSLTSTPTLDRSWKVAGTGDFDGDKKADILWRNDDGSVALWQMNGAAVTASTAVSKVGNDWKIAGIGDFNGDGKSDLLWRNDNGSVALWQMNGAAVVSSSFTSTPSVDHSWKIAGTGDFNGDAKSDIFWRNDLGVTSVWQMDGANVVSASLTSVPAVDNTWKIVAPML